MPTLIDRTEAQMFADDEDRSKESMKLRDLYELSSPAERQVLDDALVHTCGYSLEAVLGSSPEGRSSRQRFVTATVF